jgi:hypothetical protein
VVQEEVEFFSETSFSAQLEFGSLVIFHEEPVFSGVTPRYHRMWNRHIIGSGRGCLEQQQLLVDIEQGRYEIKGTSY